MKKKTGLTLSKEFPLIDGTNNDSSLNFNGAGSNHGTSITKTWEEAIEDRKRNNRIGNVNDFINKNKINKECDSKNESVFYLFDFIYDICNLEKLNSYWSSC